MRKPKSKSSAYYCSIVDCEHPVHCLGLCSACYSWWVRLRSSNHVQAYLEQAAFRAERTLRRLSQAGSLRSSFTKRGKRAA